MSMRPSEEFKKLNDEQKQSLDWSRSIAIRANAGSGKTTVLVQRIIQILHNHRDLNLDQIVAITFTRKAGAQLKEKLHEAIAKCITNSEGSECEFWQRHLDDLPRCPIGTIDSLCHRLLKEAIEAGLEDNLDPAFDILDGIDRTELLDQAIRRTEIELKEDEAWKNWLTTQGRYELNHAQRKLLNQSASANDIECAVGARTSLLEEALLSLLKLPALSEPLDQLKRTRPDLLAGMKDALKEMRASKQAKKPNQAFQRVAQFLATTIDNYDELTDLTLIQSMRLNLFTKGEGTPWKSGLEANGQPYFPKLNEIQQAWSEWMPEWSFDPEQIDRPELVEQFYRIYSSAAGHFHDLCREENRYDYGFLAQRAIRLLEHPNARRLINHYRFILVDEFQDTNEQQWRIVSGLAGIDPEAPVGTDKLMIVGDPQQSIYRFRNADPTVFERIIDLIQKGNVARKEQPTSYDQHVQKTESTAEQRSGLMRLKKNYRSRTPAPIEVINELSVHAFRQVGMEPQPLEAGLKPTTEHTEVVYLYPLLADADDGEPAAAETNGTDEEQTNGGEAAKEKLDNRQLELVVQELIRQRRTTCNWSKMAILLRSRNTHLLNLEKVLRDKDIPYELVGGLGFWQRQEVRDLVSLANCLANGADELALFAVLRGPLCGLDDSELLFLSTLGARRLLTGLHRFLAIQNADCDWSDFHLDEPAILALRSALDNPGFTSDRKQMILRAAERLDYNGTWRQRVDRMPHSDLLMLTIDESGAWGVYSDNSDGDAERRLANLNLFFEEVRLLESRRASSLADTARRLKKKVDESTEDEQAELTTEENDAVQVMTVHAAKGLEFHVVAVIGLERVFKLTTDSILLLDRFQHLRADQRDSELAKQLHGLPVIKFRDPDMPLKRVQPLLHQALSKIERQLGIEEEARIFHVAITRAERVLILAGAGSNAKTWPRNNTWQKWLHDALGIDRNVPEGEWADASNPALRMRVVRTLDSSVQSVPESAEKKPSFDLTPYSESSPRRTIAATQLEDMLKIWNDPQKRSEWEMEYRYRVKPRARSVPSGLIDGSKPEIDEQRGKLIGTLVHRALEFGEAFPTDSRNQRELLIAHATALLGEHGIDPEEPGIASIAADSAFPFQIADTALTILKDILPNNPFKGLLEAEGESEIDFTLVIGNWVITCRFDRLIRGKNGSWEIVDWKTDAGKVEAIVDRYRPQMKLYALALYESLPEADRPAEVVVHLALTAARASRKLTFTMSELVAYRKELETGLPKI